ncbi:MAG TPA: Fe2+-dependent dioxygenase [Nevskiaceae bacterium]|nr:Fe2+-dependent dioxygenase [Nevskiaceae bacterium]
MLVRIPQVLKSEQVAALRAKLDDASAPWVDGRVTAGHMGSKVKHNSQIAEGSVLARELGEIVLGALERNAQFISAALPARVYPPMFNRYQPGMQFGDHVDNAVRLIPGSALQIRTDISATLFLTAPEDYDGGELVVEDHYGHHSARLPAGDLLIYSADSVHRVTPVTRGARVSCFFWVQSMVRDDAQRRLLYDLDRSVQRLNAAGADEQARLTLTGCYHNLLRMWSHA